MAPSLWRRVRRTLIPGMALLVLAPMALAGAAPPSTQPTWVVRGAFPFVSQSPDVVGCPTTTTCVEIGTNDAVLGSDLADYSTDAGATWRQGAIPAKTGYLRSLSCGSATTCSASGFDQQTGDEVIVVTQDGGRHWSVRFSKHEANSQFALLTVSCAPGGSCVAISSPTNGVVTQESSTDGGLSWVASAPFTALHLTAVLGVSCPSAGVCVAAGTAHLKGWVGRTSNDGATWMTEPLPTTIQGATSVSCGSATFCVLLAQAKEGFGTLSTTTGGTKWTFSPNRDASPEMANSLLCLPQGSCYLAGYNQYPPGPLGGLLLTSTNSGIAWHRVAVPASSGGLAGIACTAPTTCVLVGVAVGPVAQVLRVKGATVSTITTSIDSYVAVASLTCTSALRCVAVGSGPTATGEGAVALTTSSGGAHWSVQQALPPFSSLGRLACPAAQWCYATGLARRATGNVEDVARSSDAGRTWRVLPHTATTGFLAGLACPTVATCTVVGPVQPLRTTDHGARWGTVSLGGALATTSIACPTTRLCAVIGEPADGHQVAIWRSLDAGARWTLAQDLKSNSQGDQMACATARLCLASSALGTTAQIWRSVDGARTWTLAALPARTSPLDSIACSPSVCLAVGASGATTEVLQSVDGGRHFARVAAPQGVTSASCSASGCWLVLATPTSYELLAER